MPRYFYSEMANRPLTGNGVTVTFEKTGIIGSRICGIYSTDDPAQIALLEEAIRRRTGVTELSQEDYDSQVAQKKTIPFYQQSSALRPVQQLAPPQTSRVTDRQGVESVANPEAQKLSDVKAGKIEDARSVIKVDTVASPGFVKEDERVAPVEAKPKRANTKANSRA